MVALFVSHLLGLLGSDLGELLLAALLAGLLAGLGVEAEVPPAEAGRIVADEALVVHIVVAGTGPERQDVAQAPGEVVAAMGVDGLEEAEDDPQVHSDEVELTRERDPEDGGTDDANAEEHDLDGRSILCGQAERSAVRVVKLVDGLVQRSVVQDSVKPVVPGILHNEEDGDVHGYLPGGGEGDAILHSEVGRDGVEQPDLGELDGEVAQEDEGGALPLLLPGGDLLLCGGQLSCSCAYQFRADSPPTS